MSASGAAATGPSSLDGRSARREENARRLYDAAAELLATHTFPELSVDQICARAGVGRATFFRSFDSKSGLLLEFNRRLTADARARLDAQPPDDTRAALDLIRQAIVDAWRDAGRGQLGMAAEFIRSTPANGLHAAHPELLALVEDVVQHGIAAGDLADDVPADLASSLALIHLIAPVGHAIAGNEIDIDTTSTTLLDRWLRGMQP